MCCMAPRFSATADKVLGLLALAGVAYIGWAMVADAASIWHVYGGLGVVLAVTALFGIRSFGARGHDGPKMTASALRQLVADREIPFSVCTRCRVLIELPYAFSCPECGLTDTCVAVSEESERSIALAAIGAD